MLVLTSFPIVFFVPIIQFQTYLYWFENRRVMKNPGTETLALNREGFNPEQMSLIDWLIRNDYVFYCKQNAWNKWDRMPFIGQELTEYIIGKNGTENRISSELLNVIQILASVGITIAGKIRHLNFEDLTGDIGKQNVHGEQIQKLDKFCNDLLIKKLSESGLVKAIASEEIDDSIDVTGANEAAYTVVFDPLDGSSNIDVAVPVGTIFAIFENVEQKEHEGFEIFLRPGKEISAAGYLLYGSSTMLVLSYGNGVDGFTLNNNSGGFHLSFPEMKHNGTGKIYSVNDGNSLFWSETDKKWIHEKRVQRYSSRYIGSLVADFHRNLIKGGIFAYPADERHAEGKLRLLYECAPLAFICEQAGGAASDGFRRILDIKPTRLHQRSPLYIGNKKELEQLNQFHNELSGPD